VRQILVQKLSHSCVRIEVDGHSALVDPGFFAWEHPGLNLASMPTPDRLLITHNHKDHLAIPFVEALLDAFPALVIETNEDVSNTLAEAGIEATTESAQWTSQFTAPHEQTPNGSQPDNVGFLIGDVFSHPGDSYTFEESPPVLALPLLPPWGSSTEAVAVARRLSPRFVIPIHDWHLSETGKKWLHGAVEPALAEEGITLLALDDFEAVTVDVD